MRKKKGNKVIFLDVDGPLIPGRMYVTVAGTLRYGLIDTENPKGFLFDPVAVGMIRKLASETGAKIVWNTAHNSRGDELLADALHAGFQPHEMHDDPQTGFPGNPNTQHYRMFGERMRRLSAITTWLNAHPEVTHWVAIDDEVIASKNAVLVDFDLGFTVDNYNQAVAVLSSDVFVDPEKEMYAQNQIGARTLEDQIASDPEKGI